MSVTVHITIPRRQWETPNFLDTDDHDRELGRAIREESEKGLASLRGRGIPGAQLVLSTVEITLTDTARAEIVDDPEAHTP